MGQSAKHRRLQPRQITRDNMEAFRDILRVCGHFLKLSKDIGNCDERALPGNDVFQPSRLRWNKRRDGLANLLTPVRNHHFRSGTCGLSCDVREDWLSRAVSRQQEFVTQFGHPATLATGENDCQTRV